MCVSLLPLSPPAAPIRLTFLVYLNDDFEGGATTFYTPAQPGTRGGTARYPGGGTWQPKPAHVARLGPSHPCSCLSHAREGGACAAAVEPAWAVACYHESRTLCDASTACVKNAGSGACLEAHSVGPVAGNILVFPHGDTMGSLVHEGAAVTQGSKYVIRTVSGFTGLAPGPL